MVTDILGDESFGNFDTVAQPNGGDQKGHYRCPVKVRITICCSRCCDVHMQACYRQSGHCLIKRNVARKQMVSGFIII